MLSEFGSGATLNVPKGSRLPRKMDIGQKIEHGTQVRTHLRKRYPETGFVLDFLRERRSRNSCAVVRVTNLLDTNATHLESTPGLITLTLIPSVTTLFGEKMLFDHGLTMILGSIDHQILLWVASKHGHHQGKLQITHPRFDQFVRLLQYLNIPNMAGLSIYYSHTHTHSLTLIVLSFWAASKRVSIDGLWASLFHEIRQLL